MSKEITPKMAACCFTQANVPSTQPDATAPGGGAISKQQRGTKKFCAQSEARV